MRAGIFKQGGLCCLRKASGKECESKMDQKKKRLIFTCIGLVALLAVFGVLFSVFGPKATVGAKKIVVDVVHQDKTTKSYEIQTDAEYLRGALDEKSLVKGEDGPYGLFMNEVDGETVNADNQEWWCVTKNGGQQVDYSIDQQPIADGEKYEITFTVGY